MGTKDVAIEEFLDLAGHELRIPVTALKGQLQLMQRRWRKQDHREGDLAELDRLLYHTERMNSMVQVLLDAFHVAKGDVQLLPAEYEYNLGDLVARFVSVSASANQSFTIRLVDETTGEAPLLGNWDRARIEMILSVLFSNATKYSTSGEIEVRLTREDNAARIEVSDQGIGVPAKERARIFEPYTHGSNVENPGAGLGLYVAREIARAHGGEMGMRARKVGARKGGGSVFWLTLPLLRLTPLSERLRLESDALDSMSAPADDPPAGPAPAKKPTRARPTTSQRKTATESTPAKKLPARKAPTGKATTAKAAATAAKKPTTATEREP